MKFNTGDVMKFNTGDVVIVQDLNKYNGKLYNFVGIVLRSYRDVKTGKTEYGLRISGRKNLFSKDYLFWFDESKLILNLTSTKFCPGDNVIVNKECSDVYKMIGTVKCIRIINTRYEPIVEYGVKLELFNNNSDDGYWWMREYNLSIVQSHKDEITHNYDQEYTSIERWNKSMTEYPGYYYTDIESANAALIRSIDTEVRMNTLRNEGAYTMYNKFYNNNLRTLTPTIKKVIYSGPKTIVIWTDGTKTIVSCREGQDFDPYYGFCAAVTKKIFGSKHQVDKIVDKAVKEAGELNLKKTMECGESLVRGIDAGIKATEQMKKALAELSYNICRSDCECETCDNTDCQNTPDED